MAEQYLYFPPDIKVTWNFSRSTMHSTLVEYALDGSRQAKAFYPSAGIRKRSFETTWLAESDRYRVAAFLNAQRGQLGKWYLYDPAPTSVVKGLSATLLSSTDKFKVFPLMGVDPITGIANLAPNVYKNGTLLTPGIGNDWLDSTVWQARAFGTIAGPYNITAGVNDILNVSQDNYTTVNLTLPAGASVTAASIASALNGFFGPTGSLVPYEIAGGTALILYGGSESGIGGVGGPATNPGTFTINPVAHSCHATLGLPTTPQYPDGDFTLHILTSVATNDVITISVTGNLRLYVASLDDQVLEALVPNLATAAWQFRVNVREILT